LDVPRDIFEANAPTTILPYLPIGELPAPLARNLWIIFSLACFLAGWIALLRALRLPPGAALALSALAPLFPALRDNIAKGQVYAPLFLLAVIGALGAVQGQGAAEEPNAGRRAATLAGIAFGLVAIVRFYYAGL